ncbi:MAG: NAD(P)/FAD-dependent oxidoreductase [Proteobacteria bacterium]|nr:NAD(P)/FAD-dependent oxidoreductase [Pseudomonadota bacterium]MBU1714499.1 NAD(P)/FAD-dependent oxidoreductase [Pseudomonadota bacterium]
MTSRIYDCIVVGAGPGGLQAAIHLARFNRGVMIFDRGGGSTRSAIHLENYLGLLSTSGQDLIDTGIMQAKKFGVRVERKVITRVVSNDDSFDVCTKDMNFKARFVIVSSGAEEKLPSIKNLNNFFGRSFFTCVSCDGYRCVGKKVLVAGDSIVAARVALAMKQMYTEDVSLVMAGVSLPDDYVAALAKEKIEVVDGVVEELIGDKTMGGARLQNGRIIACELLMSSFGYKLNDDFLSELPLERDITGFEILTNSVNESSLTGLYVLGGLQQQENRQAIIAAGQGAVAAIDINRRILES